MASTDDSWLGCQTKCTPGLISEKKETAGPARREMGYKATPRRNVLWALNNAEANGGTTSVPRMEAAPMIKFSGRQDVERLLK
ncbi:Kinesin-like protein KIN-14H [Zea mays]|uniref:Kinesin-like protein KIN-14H n=1 Tax=Zea mays TaxID=4577 RepID=A0A317YFK9_MAIZE|nr:Kinesin-like protein KIN-14H [Zea mays]